MFVSYHDCDADRPYKDRFTELLKGSIIDKSVHDDDIDDDPLKRETVRQKIRDEFIADASVTVVLVGTRTWQRKHVDWEIGSSLRKTKRTILDVDYLGYFYPVILTIAVSQSSRIFCLLS